MKRKRRWFQFSLRCFLVVALLSGPICGWVYLERQRPLNAAFAARELKQKGWFLDCQWEVDERGSSWWGRLLGLGPMPQHCVLRLNPQSKRVSDEEMRLVSMLENVENLSLSNAEVSHSGLAHLAPVRGLEVLVVDHTCFGDTECVLL